MRNLILATLLLLAACGSSHKPPPPSAQYPIPAAGQWASGFGQSPSANIGTSFPIPGGQGLHYLYTPAPANLGSATTISLTFTVSGDATFGIADPSDIQPPMVDLFIWQAGDNLTCQGNFEYYRQFSDPRVQLQNGTYTLTVPLTQANWHDCYGKPLGLSQAIGKAGFVGFTFGGQYFDGHGVYVASGSATFTINSFTVQ